MAKISSKNIIALIIVIFGYLSLPLLIIAAIVVIIYAAYYLSNFIRYGNSADGTNLFIIVVVLLGVIYLTKRLLKWLKND